MKGQFLKLMIAVFVVLVFAGGSHAQHKSISNVAIFLFDGVEPLHVAGPRKIFSDAAWNTYTVSADGKEIQSQDSASMLPGFSIATAPAPDIIVFPGGPADAPLKAATAEVIEWLKQKKTDGALMMSISTAALVFAKAGFLDNKRATTHWRMIRDMSKTYPAVTIIENTEFVDNGDVITTAGAGIDGALHLVHKIKGLDAARTIAHNMEYDKWNPDDGLVDVENDVIKRLRTASMYKYIDSKKFSHGVLENQELVYEGELLNLAIELSAIGAYKRTALVLEVGTDLFPASDPMYLKLIDAYKRIGKAIPIEGAMLMKLIRERRIEEAAMALEKGAREFPGWITTRETEFSAVIEDLVLADGDYMYAAKVCKLALDVYPTSACLHFWMGRVHKFLGMKEQAFLSLKEAVKFDASYSDIVSKEIAELESPQKNE